MRMPPALAVLLVLAAPAAGQNEPLRDSVQRLRVLTAKSDLTPESSFLHDQIAILIERCRRAPADSFPAERLQLAISDLLDASERVMQARTTRPANDRSEETRRLMARDLERTYFRIQQGDYFSTQFQDASGGQYVRVARRLYQIARAAYDDREYGRVRLLSEAARDIIMGLERLAQAEMGVPDPPRLPEG
jgi:hypothetical protein